MKLIRLIANLLTVNDIGVDIITKGLYYKDILKKFKQLLNAKNISYINRLFKIIYFRTNGELLSCVLSCLANITYYDK